MNCTICADTLRIELPFRQGFIPCPECDKERYESFSIKSDQLGKPIAKIPVNIMKKYNAAIFALFIAELRISIFESQKNK